MISVGHPMEQFEIKHLASLEFLGYDISFTNSSLWMMLAILATFALFHFATRRQTMVPGRLQALVELIYDFIASMLKDTVGDNYMPYFPLVFTVFFFVLVGNLFGILIPHGFTYTSHFAVTVTLALIVFIGVTLLGFYKHGLHYFSLFMPEGTPIWLAPALIPIEMTSYMIRPVSLSLRLFINMMVGHILLKVFAAMAGSLGMVGFIPSLVDVGIMGLELMVAVIQAYIFAFLTCIYLKDAVHLH